MPRGARPGPRRAGKVSLSPSPGRTGDARAIQPLVMACDPENTVRNAPAALYKIDRRWDESRIRRSSAKNQGLLKHNDYGMSGRNQTPGTVQGGREGPAQDDDALIKLAMKSGPSPVYALFADI